MLKPVADAGAADWIIDRRAPFNTHSVASLVPFGFERYARILHPAWKPIGETWIPIRWCMVAKLNGVPVHKRMEWDDITGPNSDLEGIEQPMEGSMPAVVLHPLRDILSSHTNSDPCWLAVWDGWGGALHSREFKGTSKLDVGGGREYSLFRASLDSIDQNFLELYDSDRDKSLAFDFVANVPWWQQHKFKQEYIPAEVRNHPEREKPFPDPRSLGETASLIWANDRSWFLNQDIDLVDTFIGGNSRLIEDILASDALEAWAVNTNDSRFPDDWSKQTT